MLLIGAPALALLAGSLQLAPDTASTGLARLDSLYRARDTAQFVREVREWTGGPAPRIELYRALADAWTGRATRSIPTLRALLDSSGHTLTIQQRRDVLSALAASYARTRRYREAASLYEGELSQLDASLDSARQAAATQVDTVRAAPILDELTSPVTEPPSPRNIQSQLGFIALLFALFLVPKMLQRFRIPGAITSLLMGFAATALGLFHDDVTLRLLSTLGIVSLFLFAGLEIDEHELKENARPLALYGAIWAALATITAIGVAFLFDMDGRPAALIALALVTPSTGFILSSLASFGLTSSEQNSVRTYAIGSELIALAALFFVLQSSSARQLAISLSAMAGVIIIIPIAFRLFATVVAPYAPRSEFAFLLMVGIACAYATRVLGVYYLVGAFLVGVAAQRFRASHPAMSSEKMVDALEAFGSVFIPFYFFHAGMEIVGEHITWRAVGGAALLLAVLVPLRVAAIALHRGFVLGEPFAVSRRVGSAMVPTLVFTLVIVGILDQQFSLSPVLAGALVLYTIVNTTLPAIVLKAQAVDFTEVEALPLTRAPADG